MAHPYHHTISSWRKIPEDEKTPATEDLHHELHTWMDSSKMILADPRHRALFHHESFARHLAPLAFPTLKGAQKIAEEHIIEDVEELKTLADWIPTEYWPETLEPKGPTSAEELAELAATKLPRHAQKGLLICANLLLLPQKDMPSPSQPQQFFYFSAAGPFICERILGEILPGTVWESPKIPTRVGAELLVRTLWGGNIPSLQDLICQRPIEDWMWKKARPLSREL
jgi:hypothetical protein